VDADHSQIYPIPATYVFQYEDDEDGSRYWFNRDKQVLLAIHYDEAGNATNFTLDYTDENGAGYQDANSRIAEGRTWIELVASAKSERTYDFFDREWRAGLLTTEPVA
jgi:hypothetical protein